MQKVALDNSTIDTLRKKPRVIDRTDRAWFSWLLRHPARKRNRSILSTPEPTWETITDKTERESSSSLVILQDARQSFVEDTDNWDR